jgi:hypothetical protein
MPILLWVIFPLAVWTACMPSALLPSSAEAKVKPSELSGG